jgi:SAM-dependent methyltransferase
MLSIITPFGKSHEPYLLDALASVKEQTEKDFEWVLIPNGGAVVPKAIRASGLNVRVFQYKGPKLENGAYPIGALKRFACKRTSGSIIVEFDADDILLPTCLEKVKAALAPADAVFAFSNDAYFEDETWASRHFSEYYGNRFRPFNYEGHVLEENLTKEATAHSLRQIFWSPDHVRAWKEKAYWDIGGHDEALAVGDDHDLMCRFYIRYGEFSFRHINEVLYLYRTHPNNSCTVHNAAIQVQTDQNYLRYSRALATKWAQGWGLELLELGCRDGGAEGYTTVDIEAPARVQTDLNRDWPFDDGSVGVIRASHIFEHLQDPLHTINEAFRVLAPGGWLFVDVPSTDGRGAFQDPTHVSFWNENSFWYYTDENWARFIRPRYKGKFQLSRSVTWFPSEFERVHNIPIVQADLICFKEPYYTNHIGERKI